jgi:type IV fimbrial biogenesis protein FimT
MTVPRSRRPAAARGFTLIELMVTLSIATILGLVAAPSLRGMVAMARLKSHNGALQESLMLARSEAIKRHQRVVLCKSSDLATCAAGGDWNQGWIVFVDANDSASVNTGEPILLKMPALTDAFVLRATGNVTDYVSYTGTGAAKVAASQDFQAGVFTLCRPGSMDARQTEIFPTGRLSLRADPVAGCTAS